MADQLSDLLERVRTRYNELSPSSDAQGDFLAHLRSLARGAAEPQDYPQLGPVNFPQRLRVAYAVCHPECGTREFIVEGSTQECQYCGGLLYRTEARDYDLSARDTRSQTGTV